MHIRQIVFDTETTGLETSEGHRIIEIGGVEIVNRRLTGNHFHRFLQPDREIDQGAIAIHGITNESLLGQPRFADIVDDLLDYIRGAELVIHNAAFDVGFIDYELSLLNISKRVADMCTVFDTLSYARRLHPGQRNSLDALCRRYHVDNTQRSLHGALLDAELLADVYLAMTGGQLGLSLEVGPPAQTSSADTVQQSLEIRPVTTARPALPVIRASAAENLAHDRYLERLQASSNGHCIWLSRR
jgi:DNA polymerase-3 subunit epsilon